eukprot:759928-Hanusia_phi.AAC.4
MQTDTRHMFVLRMAGAAVDEKDESSTTTHHILKFHQMDVKVPTLPLLLLLHHCQSRDPFVPQRQSSFSAR